MYQLIIHHDIGVIDKGVDILPISKDMILNEKK
jgi:hypothetical protein